MAQPRRTVLVTGATGFVGRHVVQRLVAGGFNVRALVRNPGPAEFYTPELSRRRGDLRLAETLAPAMAGCDVVVHLVGIITENRRNGTFYQAHVAATQNVLKAAKETGIGRIVHMSALGARPDAPARYHRTKWEAEEAVKRSGLVYTIFRPSLIIGDDGDFTRQLNGWLRGTAPPFLFAPYFGGGFAGQAATSRVQPIAVDDVAAYVAASIDNRAAWNRIFCLGGPEQYTWPELYAVMARGIRHGTRRAAGIPAWLGKALTALPLPGLPFNRDQVLMSQEDNTCDTSPAREAFPDRAPANVTPNAG